MFIYKWRKKKRFRICRCSDQSRTELPFEKIGQREPRGEWHSDSWRKCKGPCCTCALELAEDKYRESTRALGRANGLAKGIRPGEYFEDAKVKFAMGLNDNNLFGLFAGELLRMYLDSDAVARYCLDSRSLEGCEYVEDQHKVLQVVLNDKEETWDCDCPTCRRVQVQGGTKQMRKLTGRRHVDLKQVHVRGWTRELFDAWERTDNSMLSLGSEVVSQIFISSLAQFTDGGRYINNRREEARRLSYIPLTLIGKLGPPQSEEELASGRDRAAPPAAAATTTTGGAAAAAAAGQEMREQRSGVLDFTIQNKKGQTAFNLSTDYKDTYPALGCIRGAIDCSRPMYKDVLPTKVELAVYNTLPLRYLAGVGGFFFDLGTDIAVARTYWIEDRYGPPYAWACIVILIFHVLMQILFDWFTSMKNKRPSDRDWTMFARKVAMNVFHVRILKEAWSGLTNWRMEALTGRKATPRTIPASFDQVKLIEGLFEGLPQAILQTYLAVQDINRGATKDINVVRIISLFTSYLSFATALGSMGMRIQPVWRGAFVLYVLTQVVMRSLTLTYFVFQVVQSTDTIFTLSQDAGIWLWLYLSVSWWMTVLFDFINHKKGGGSSNLVPTWSGLFSSVFAFMVPVNLQEFTVLKTAMPRAAPLPFFVFRQLEMLAIGIWFIHEVYCESEPLPGTGLTSMDERDAVGWHGDCSLQTMESICTIAFDAAADSDWQVGLGHLGWSDDDYQSRLVGFCSCTLPAESGGGGVGVETQRGCDDAEKAKEQAYRDALALSASEGDGVGVGTEALEKERTGGKVSLLISNAFFFTTFNYLLVAVLPYDKSDRLHSGLRSLVWDNKGLIGCLRCLPCLRHLGEGSGDFEADDDKKKAKQRPPPAGGGGGGGGAAAAAGTGNGSSQYGELSGGRAQAGYGGGGGGGGGGGNAVGGGVAVRRVAAGHHAMRTGAGGAI